MELTEADIQPQMTRRRPGQSAITTPRNEKDRVIIQSGTEFGVTLGTPIGMLVNNEDQRPKGKTQKRRVDGQYKSSGPLTIDNSPFLTVTDYGNSTMDLYPRPSHADWTYLEKYGVKASSGGGRASARETIGRVAAGAIAEKYLRLAYGVEIVAFVSSVGPVHLFPPSAEHPTPATDPAFQALVASIDRAAVDRFLPVRCPDADASRRMEECITRHRDRNDSIGGTVACVIRNLPAGLGEPCFDKLEAMLAHAMLSIPATKGFEIGSGFGGCEIPGSRHNDPFAAAGTSPPAKPDLGGAASGGGAPAEKASGNSIQKSPLTPRSQLTTKTNLSGGIQGGISNGMPVYFRVAFKPPATIGQAQTTATYDGLSEGVLAAKGRHDPCVVPRAVPIVEAMAALVVMDAAMAQQARLVTRQMLPKAVPQVPVAKAGDGIAADGDGEKKA